MTDPHRFLSDKTSGAYELEYAKKIGFGFSIFITEGMEA